MEAYDLLGLAPGASAKEIKKAFRRLAMRWHPDRNADPAALEHFKALRAAYEDLLAGLAVEADDEDGADQSDDAAAEDRGADADDIPRGADRRQDLTLTIEEAYCGGETTLKLEDETECAECQGSGEEVLMHTRLCAHCHGTGRIRSKHGLLGCKHCAGRGYLTKHACPACAGSGRMRTVRPLVVPLPPGLLGGDELRIAGAGEAHEAGLPGDLILRVRLARHALYRLDGRNLLLSRPVSALRMLIGGELAIPMPGGTRMLKLAPGSATARDLRVAGAGFPGRGGQPAGDLIVQLAPVLPDAPDAEMRALIAQLDTLVAAKHSRHLPDVALWEARWLHDRPDAP
ncbi:DnaJ C-terminal domain-containing protein [Aromatoleum diolicum]|uniref:DnaJ domain-containing protein n=1 Tax=Aromatoleum diolicum TaxID=75796 RepID=A0ABX1QDW4_9RHOO|nr:DnaJ C-terminal domain-containing protein [Aromatoleum diolicum]NMG75687.1 DnaJ domain-containing protein [Aromatoleum diolicum]